MLVPVAACAEQSRGMSMARGAGGDVSATAAKSCSGLENPWRVWMMGVNDTSK